MRFYKYIFSFLIFANAFIFGLLAVEFTASVNRFLVTENKKPSEKNSKNNATKIRKPDVTEGQGSSLHNSGSGCGCCSHNSDHNSGHDFSKASVITPLQIISRPRAEYTQLARQNGIEGTVRLRIAFLSNGQIGSVKALRELPDGLTEQAFKAARNIRFTPRKIDGRPATVSQTVEYRFSLD